MGYGLKLKDLGVVQNALAFTGKARPNVLNNLHPKQPIKNTPQWLKPKETK